MSGIKSSIQFDHLGIGAVLKQYKLVVPPNQREYSWTDKEVKNLLQDIAKAISADDSSYFLGTIVTIPKRLDVLEVIDGQQRLATTCILLAEIRSRLLEAKEKVIADSIRQDFLCGIDRSKRDYVPKMNLNVGDNEFFRNLILDDGIASPDALKPSHKLLLQASKECREHMKHVIATVAQKDHGDLLNSWIQFIEHSAQVILMRVPTTVNAYKMFETLNDRGLKTTQSDLVKNYLFGQTTEDRLPEAQQKWAAMRAVLETLDEDEITITFLRHALIALRGYLREGEVYEKVQDQAKGSTAAMQFLSILEGLSNTYVATLNPEHEKWNSYPDKMRHSLRTMCGLKIRPFRPLMLAVAAKFSEKEATQTFCAMISWGVRLLIASSTRSGSVEQPIANAAQKVYLEEIQNYRALLAELKHILPNNEQFQQAFEIAHVSKAALARYYLRSLERTAKEESDPYFIPNDDKETINLEHILPITPGPEWGHITEDELRACVTRLGNQALLLAKSNSEAKSAGFEEKKAIYSATPYVLTSQLAEADKWDAAQIANRQKTLASLAPKTWPI